MRLELATYLEGLLGISNWKSIQFSLLPGDDPVGYIQLSRVNTTYNSTVQSYNYLCWIALAKPSLDELFTEVESLVDTLVDALTKPNVCINGIAKLSLQGDIVVDTPDSYVNNNVTTSTEGFKTAIAFQIKADRIMP